MALSRFGTLRGSLLLSASCCARLLWRSELSSALLLCSLLRSQLLGFPNARPLRLSMLGCPGARPKWRLTSLSRWRLVLCLLALLSPPPPYPGPVSAPSDFGAWPLRRSSALWRSTTMIPGDLWCSAALHYSAALALDARRSLALIRPRIPLGR